MTEQGEGKKENAKKKVSTALSLGDQDTLTHGISRVYAVVELWSLCRGRRYGKDDPFRFFLEILLSNTSLERRSCLVLLPRRVVVVAFMLHRGK